MRQAEVFDCDPQPLRYFKRSLAVGIRQDDSEFFPAVSRRQVLRTIKHDSHSGSDGTKTIIANLMTVFVVKAFESVDVDQQQGHLSSAANGAPPFPVQG